VHKLYTGDANIPIFLKEGYTILNYMSIYLGVAIEKQCETTARPAEPDVVPGGKP